MIVLPAVILLLLTWYNTSLASTGSAVLCLLLSGIIIADSYRRAHYADKRIS